MKKNQTLKSKAAQSHRIVFSLLVRFGFLFVYLFSVSPTEAVGKAPVFRRRSFVLCFLFRQCKSFVSGNPPLSSQGQPFRFLPKFFQIHSNVDAFMVHGACYWSSLTDMYFRTFRLDGQELNILRLDRFYYCCRSFLVRAQGFICMCFRN